MRKFLITAAAGAMMFVAGSFSASAMTPGVPSTDGINPVSKAAICFYIDGWNGPGLYECGYRYRRGHGWHGHRHGHHHNARRGHRGGHHGHKRGHRGHKSGHHRGHKGKRH